MAEHKKTPKNILSTIIGLILIFAIPIFGLCFLLYGTVYLAQSVNKYTSMSSSSYVRGRVVELSHFMGNKVKIRINCHNPTCEIETFKFSDEDESHLLAALGTNTQVDLIVNGIYFKSITAVVNVA